jgi:hypothetical protein
VQRSGIMIEIPLTKGYTAIVDDKDADLAEFKWHASEKRRGAVYAQRGVWINRKVKHTLMHRVILERMVGHPLKRTDFCDHKDGNGLNNQRSNLRLAPRTQNARSAVRRQYRRRYALATIRSIRAIPQQLDRSPDLQLQAALRW